MFSNLKRFTSGQTLVKVFKTNDVSGLVIAKFNNKKFADKIKIMNNSEIKKIITNLKIKSFDRLFEYS